MARRRYAQIKVRPYSYSRTTPFQTGQYGLFPATLGYLYIQLFNPEWPVPVRSPKVPAAECSNCEYLNKQLQEKHEVLLTLINKGNDVQKQLQESQEKEMELQSEIEKLKNNNSEFRNILDEYDLLLNELIKDRNVHKSQSDVASTHLTNLEFSFSDVHLKYERAKQILEGYKENEVILLESIKENERTIVDLQNKYEKLKENSVKKFQEANETLRNMEQQHKDDVQKYKTKQKMLELTISSLENALQQKVQENMKLSSICDEFINKD